MVSGHLPEKRRHIGFPKTFLYFRVRVEVKIRARVEVRVRVSGNTSSVKRPSGQV